MGQPGGPFPWVLISIYAVPAVVLVAVLVIANL